MQLSFDFHLFGVWKTPKTGGCGEAFCDDDITPFAQGRAIGRDVPDSEGSLMASYSVYVVDPGAAPRNFSLDSSLISALIS